MSVVYDERTKCPQCGYPEALSEYDCCAYSSGIMCWRCGFEESDGPVRDAGGQITGWKREAKYGAGAMWCGNKPGGGGVAYCWHEAQEIAESEAWLREQIASGTYSGTASYLTRWNEDTQQVEVVIGRFPRGREFPGSEGCRSS